MGLGLRAAAKELGISHVALLKAKTSGRVQAEPDGSYDVEKCRKSLKRNSNPEKQRQARSQQRKPAANRSTEPAEESGQAEPGGRNPGDNSLSEALRQKEWIRVQRDQLELSVKKGESAPIGEINAFVAGMIIAARDILLRIGPELKDRLAQEDNPHKCEEMVNTEVRRALSKLAEYRPNAA